MGLKYRQPIFSLANQNRCLSERFWKRQIEKLNYFREQTNLSSVTFLSVSLSAANRRRQILHSKFLSVFRQFFWKEFFFISPKNAFRENVFFLLLLTRHSLTHSFSCVHPTESFFGSNNLLAYLFLHVHHHNGNYLTKTSHSINTKLVSALLLRNNDLWNVVDLRSIYKKMSRDLCWMGQYGRKCKRKKHLAKRMRPILSHVINKSKRQTQKILCSERVHFSLSSSFTFLLLVRFLASLFTCISH